MSGGSHTGSGSALVQQIHGAESGKINADVAE
jgi:hypothetical protein